jgi:6-phosphofructokinase 1
MGGLAGSLANFANAKTKAKVRGIELSLLQRCAAHIASAVDINESYDAGRAAFEAAVAGMTDKMVAFQRAPGVEYKCETVFVDLVDVANQEKKIPREWINAAGNGLLQPFVDYATPLIQGDTELPVEGGLPRFARLKRVMTRDI